MKAKFDLSLPLVLAVMIMFSSVHMSQSQDQITKRLLWGMCTWAESGMTLKDNATDVVCAERRGFFVPNLADLQSEVSHPRHLWGP